MKLLAAGRQWRGVHGDLTQLRAHYIVDTKGVLRLAYYTHDPTDRPPIDHLLATLSDLKGTRNERNL